jgi:hypothetical protein
MFIPAKDIKLATYKTNVCHKNKKIHIFSTSKLGNQTNNINTCIYTQKILLKTCIEKEHVIGFDITNHKILNAFEQYPYKLFSVSVDDVLLYCKTNNISLLIKQEKPKHWLKIDDDVTNLYNIDFML